MYVHAQRFSYSFKDIRFSATRNLLLRKIIYIYFLVSLIARFLIILFVITKVFNFIRFCFSNFPTLNRTQLLFSLSPSSFRPEALVGCNVWCGLAQPSYCFPLLEES